MQRIEVTIDPTGDAKVEAIGFSGPGCKQATEAIERAIGRTTADAKKAEYISTRQIQHGAQHDPRHTTQGH